MRLLGSPMRFVHEVPRSRVVFGAGCRVEAAVELDRLGVQHPLMIATKTAPGACEIATLLAGSQVSQWSDIQMHVPADVATRATNYAQSNGVDGLLVIGGGSAIGTAKAIAKQTALPMVAIPTTYSGSEMTPIWGITEDGKKITGRDAKVLPQVVVYDPELTLQMPSELAVASGFNALAHLVEALYAPKVSPLAMLTAQEGVHAVAGGLRQLTHNPQDLVAREQILYGAWLAGWSLGTTGMGVQHRVCHVLGGKFGLPHAATHSALLPYAIALNAKAAPVAMSSLRDALSSALSLAGNAVDHEAGAMWDLRRELQAPESLASLGFTLADIPTAVKAVLADPLTNPRPISSELIYTLLLAALLGERPQENLG
jgi:maleylacetate reductase